MAEGDPIPALVARLAAAVDSGSVEMATAAADTLGDIAAAGAAAARDVAGAPGALGLLVRAVALGGSAATYSAWALATIDKQTGGQPAPGAPRALVPLVKALAGGGPMARHSRDCLGRLAMHGFHGQVARLPGALKAFVEGLDLGGEEAQNSADALFEISLCAYRGPERVAAVPGAVERLVQALADDSLLVTSALTLSEIAGANAGTLRRVAAAPGALAAFAHVLARFGGVEACGSAWALATIAGGGYAQEVAATPGVVDDLVELIDDSEVGPSVVTTLVTLLLAGGAAARLAAAAPGALEGLAKATAERLTWKGARDGLEAASPERAAAFVRLLLGCLHDPAAAPHARALLREVNRAQPDAVLAELEAGAARAAALLSENEELRAIPVNTRAAIIELATAVPRKRPRH